MTEESSHEPSPSGEAGRPEKPTPSATQYAQLSFQLSKSVLGFQSTFAEIAKQRHAHISALLTPQLS
ncbi:hypothetical protein, partial [Streptomyces sp. MK5]|uniref:hypothetical protein n=1 Tax=Streptomyces sp. MK5 TaxID=3064253 RepID=UPI002741F056